MSTNERPYEMTYVVPKLKELFTPHLPAATHGTPEARERNFLTRALAAYAIRRLSNCSIEDAANSVIDGSGDGGIDALYYSATASTLWLVQAKYMDSGRGQPSLADAGKFKNGVEALITKQFDAFTGNAKWPAVKPTVEKCLANVALQVRTAIVYTGTDLLSDDRVRLFETLKNTFNNEDEFVLFTPYGLTSVAAWINGLEDDVGVEKIEVDVFDPGHFKAPYETILGRIKIEDAVKLYTDHGEKLIAANIRRFKGRTAVNERIKETANNEPQHLFYLNNGLTAYCDRFEIPHEDKVNVKKKRVTAYGLSVVNGAQTLGSLLKAYPNPPTTPTNGYVSVKIISLHGCEDDKEFARRITEATNFQNEVGTRDFVAIDDQQEHIAAQLKMSGINYHYKYGDETPESNATNFTLDDAMVALTCLENDFDLCARLIANRKSLLSFDRVYPETELLRSRYERLFQPSRSARTIWRAVQTYWNVLDKMKAEARTSEGVRKAFYETGRWLVLKILFIKLRPEQGEELALSEDEKNAITAKALEIGTHLWTVYEEQGLSAGTTHPRSVFSNSADCERLFNATMAKLAATPVAGTGT